MYSQVVWIGGMSSLLVRSVFLIVLCLLFSSVGLSGNIILICWFFWCQQLIWSQIEGFNICSTALL
jgi:uncharacterized membrane protein YqjE